ncbi:hypothetical protein KIW84_043989 [Lathyrus oleraceus]|uniref:Uncharacterized protein n=1 Tax=Pisum sativum TaxID=3888 RepID=A0A9D5APT1_PEA|nr:hypothetical protein KIW84_043989 [Pisum sativum]
MDNKGVGDGDKDFDDEGGNSKDWTTVLPTNKETIDPPFEKSSVEFEQGHNEDFDQLHIPHDSEDEQEYENFPSYESGERIKFQLGMVFNNKYLIRDAIKEYATETMKNVFLEKNVGKRMVSLLMVANFTRGSVKGLETNIDKKRLNDLPRNLHAY